MKTNRILLLSVCAGDLLLSPNLARAQSATTSQTDDTRAYFEVLRSDFNATKIRTINQAMKLTRSEAEVFWPIYRNYEKELATVAGEKLALIREFFTHHKDGTLNDANAKEMPKSSPKAPGKSNPVVLFRRRASVPGKIGFRRVKTTPNA